MQCIEQVQVNNNLIEKQAKKACRHPHPNSLNNFYWRSHSSLIGSVCPIRFLLPSPNRNSLFLPLASCRLPAKKSRDPRSAKEPLIHLNKSHLIFTMGAEPF